MMEEFGHIMYPTKCRVYEIEVRTEVDYNACIRRHDTGASNLVCNIYWIPNHPV
jgi:hypothetical protein